MDEPTFSSNPEPALLWLGDVVQMDRGSTLALMREKDIGHVILTIG